MEHALFVCVFKNKSLDSIKFSRLFSSAVLGENLRYGYSLGNVVVVGLQKLWHRPVIIESIYFKLRSMCSLSKEQSILSRETTQNAIFFQNYAPFSTRTFFCTFCNIYVITEGIDLKRGVYLHYPKSNPY